MLKKAIYGAVFLLSACGPSSHSPNYPGSPITDRPVNPQPMPTATSTPKPIPGQRLLYQPSWMASFWASNSYFMTGGEPGNYGVLPGEEPIADSIYRFWESVRNSWSESLIHGSIPSDYLQKIPSGFEHIDWTDKTEGKIQGFEKLKVTLQEMELRCPQLVLPELQAPLEVVWATERETTAPGQFFGNNPLLNFERDRTAFSANLNARPQLNVRAEWVKDYVNGSWDGWKWPNQTFKEQTGGKSWADGGIAIKTLDETFAHEYGHFLLQAWALNHGRNTLQTQWFSESWAELFRAVCWGDMKDYPARSANDMKDLATDWSFDSWKQRYREYDHRFTASAEYTLGSIGYVISDRITRSEYSPEEVFDAMLGALSDMEGLTISSYPVKSTYDGSILMNRTPWSLDIFPSILRDAPKLWTRQEFLPALCKRLDCGKAKPLVDAEAKGLSRDEY